MKYVLFTLLYIEVLSLKIVKPELTAVKSLLALYLKERLIF